MYIHTVRPPGDLIATVQEDEIVYLLPGVQ